MEDIKHIAYNVYVTQRRKGHTLMYLYIYIAGKNSYKLQGIFLRFIIIMMDIYIEVAELIDQTKCKWGLSFNIFIYKWNK